MAGWKSCLCAQGRCRTCSRNASRSLGGYMSRRTQMVIAAAATAGAACLVALLRHKRVKTLPYGYGIKLKKSVTVNKAPEVLYRYWRNLENLPQFMQNVAGVRVID